jgi:hypothetical protein
MGKRNMYVRKILRSWMTKTGEKKQKVYYYWYQSKRVGSRVISNCIGPATESDYKEHRKKEN